MSEICGIPLWPPTRGDWVRGVFRAKGGKRFRSFLALRIHRLPAGGGGDGGSQGDSQKCGPKSVRLWYSVGHPFYIDIFFSTTTDR
ncbi:uncharacterized protein C14orf166B-like protein [Anopheles sinensis]|uniref:Uncharacterized protein C14orf166B-like protein n=1 Tax=Anopheles sinensis TaxID=74873 RepID=A0A084W678_ANOSI|nr:uncharacterized protein C14orf166B-like protein [Anopheles sinensis]